MNKFSYVSEDTRKRVEEVVERLGYNPSALARSLIQRRSYTLGWLRPSALVLTGSKRLFRLTEVA